MATAKLKTRKLTGNIPTPLILVEGREGTGKTYAGMALSQHPLIRTARGIDLGEGSMDEYAPIAAPGFEMIDHNGTFEDIAQQIEAVCATPAPTDGRFDLLVIDSASLLWSQQIDMANATARAKKRTDPTMAQWATAKKNWRRIMDKLMTYHGIVVLTARGKESIVMNGSAPAVDRQGKTITEWKVEAEKSIGYDVNFWIRFTGHRQAELVKARSLRFAIPEGGTLPLPDFDLATFIFDQAGIGGANTAARQITALDSDVVPADDAKIHLANKLRAVGVSDADMRDVAVPLWTKAGFDGKEEVSGKALQELLASLDAPAEEPQSPSEPAAPADQEKAEEPNPYHIDRDAQESPNF